VEVFIGGFLGAMLIFLFSSFAIARWAGRRRDDRGSAPPVAAEPRILTGEVPPDYAACVDISVRAALREMIIPGLLAVACRSSSACCCARGAAGMLMVGTMVGILMANVLNNGGGAWDNAKKFIEAGG
jgi:K(+)-stimulated pyrophosphate-energized sodium pump